LKNAEVGNLMLIYSKANSLQDTLSKQENQIPKQICILQNKGSEVVAPALDIIVSTQAAFLGCT
jgi:hypothetical protein